MLKSKTLLLILIPMTILFELCAISVITDLIRQPSDMAVFIGVISSGVFLWSNYYIFNTFKLIIKK